MIDAYRYIIIVRKCNGRNYFWGIDVGEEVNTKNYLQVAGCTDDNIYCE
jgi:hypothetical protein